MNIVETLVGGFVLIVVVLLCSAVAVVSIGGYIEPTLSDIANETTTTENFDLPAKFEHGKDMFFIAIGVIVLGCFVFVAVKLLYWEENFSGRFG